MKHNGLFVTFEKTRDGLGGTTQAQLLYERLKKEGFDVILTREIGGTKWGERIRDDIIYGTFPKSQKAVLLAITAARAQHMEEKIIPHLKKGGIVISDRFVDSTYALQGYGEGMDFAKIAWLQDYATDGLIPNKTFVFYGKSYKEMDQFDHFEKKSKEERDRIADGMMKIAESGSRYVKVDANRELNVIADEIYNEVISMLQVH